MQQVPVKQSQALTREIKQHARRLGFVAVGVTSAAGFPRARAAIHECIRKGYLEGMPWLIAPDRIEKSCDPAQLLQGARSIISLAISYNSREPASHEGDNALRGKVARYAWGDDYHKVIEGKLEAFAGYLRSLGASDRGVRVFVDTGPMVDRAAAQRAGIGWYGKNTNILIPGIGSWVFLAQVVTDLSLDEDGPLAKDCGICTRCLDACPTGALVAPYVLDSTRCISYLTIENRGDIPRELRPAIGEWVFGCDICQEVCPVNRRAPVTMELSFRATSLEQSRPDLIGLLEMDEEEYGRRFRNSAMKRAKLAGLKRNACVLLGNLRRPEAAPTLARALHDNEPMVRRHAAWALGRIGGTDARRVLEQARAEETDLGVVTEIGEALREPARQQT